MFSYLICAALILRIFVSLETCRDAVTVAVRVSFADADAIVVVDASVPGHLADAHAEKEG